MIERAEMMKERGSAFGRKRDRPEKAGPRPPRPHRLIRPGKDARSDRTAAAPPRSAKGMATSILWATLIFKWGAPGAPTVLLLHGFPTSSHMYRELIPALSDRYHVVAPDLPGFGFTDAPDRAGFKYTFDHLTDVIERFTEVLGLSRDELTPSDRTLLLHGEHDVLVRSPTEHDVRLACIVGSCGIAVYHFGDSRSADHDMRSGLHPFLAFLRLACERVVIVSIRAALQHVGEPHFSFWRRLVRQQRLEPFKAVSVQAHRVISGRARVIGNARKGPLVSVPKPPVNRYHSGHDKQYVHISTGASKVDCKRWMGNRRIRRRRPR
jgi:hypothetical protein